MRKIAILFGNNNYNGHSLKNAINDASDLSTKLKELEFETFSFYDLNIKDMAKQLDNFRKNLVGADVGLFFFAGHGLQVNGENFLATTDTCFEEESSCKYTSFPLNDVINILEESKVLTKIIILDACRDNLFILKYRGISSAGLAPVCAPKGTIIAFSTSPGQKASDGKGPNGVYTSALLSHIGTKKISIEDMFKRVRNTVSANTNNKQITWEHTSLMGNFYFNSGYNSGSFSITYSDNALADKDYVFDTENEIKSIIEDLKSHNFYIQNPAIQKFSKVNLTNIDIDELFVLGRNIYQAACGGAWDVKEWIDNLENNLNKYSDSIQYHLLNGILFEIYFDSTGALRKRFKSNLSDAPIRLCNKEKYSKSAAFILNKLINYPQKILYLPGSEDKILLDVTLEQTEHKEYHLVQIYINGMPCLYDETGEELYDSEMYNYMEIIPKKDFEDIVCNAIVAPKNRVMITYNFLLNQENTISAPHKLNLLNYGN